MYRTDASLQPTGPPVGELGLEHDLANKALDGAEDAVKAMATGLARLITHPIQTLTDLAKLPGAVYQLIVNSPEYWEQFKAMPLGDQVRRASELVSSLLLMYGTAAGTTTRITAAAADLTDITVSVLRLQGNGTLAVAQVSVPIGSIATAMAGGPGAVYILAMASTAAGGGSSGGSGGGSGDGPRSMPTTASGLPIDTPVNTGKMLGVAVKRCVSASPSERLSLFRTFVAEITEASKGSWTASPAAGTAGETIFMGGAGRTLVIDSKGGMWVGDIQNIQHFRPARLPSGGLGWTADYANLKPIT